MLQSFRSAADSWPMKILLGVLLLSFVFWDTGGMFSGSSYRDAATVGDTSITQQEFDAAVQQEMSRYSAMLNGKVPSLLQAALEDDVETRLVNRSLLEEEAKALGIIVSDETAAQRIRENPAFSDGTGFNRDQFKQAIEYAGFTEASYIAQVKKELASELLLDVIMSIVPPLDTQAKLLHRHRNEARTATLVTLPADYIADVAEPDDQTLATFFSERADQFSAPEYRRVNALILSRMDVLSELDISDEMVAAYYAENKDAFRTPDKFTLRYVTLPDFARLDMVQDALASDGTLSTLHAEDADIPAEWTEVDETPADALPPELIARLGALSTGEYTEYSDDDGLHLYQLVARAEGGIEPLEDAKPRISQELMEGQMDQLLYDRSIVVEDALAGGATLTEAATLGGVQVQSFGPLDRQGKLADGSPAEKLPPVPDFLNETFSLEGEPPFLARGRNGVFYALELDSVTDPRSRALDEVRGLVVQQWKTEERAKRIEQVAQGVVARLKQGEALDTLVSEMSLSTPETHRLTRASATDAPTEDIAAELPTLRDTLFSQETGTYSDPLQNKDGAWIIARLDAVHMADAPTDEEMAALKEELTKQYQMDMLETYTQYLRSKHPVEILRTPTQLALDGLDPSQLQ